MSGKLIQGIFILSILGLLVLGLVLFNNHFGFALTFSKYIFILIILGIVIYIYCLHK